MSGRYNTRRVANPRVRANRSRSPQPQRASSSSSSSNVPRRSRSSRSSKESKGEVKPKPLTTSYSHPPGPIKKMSLDLTRAWMLNVLNSKVFMATIYDLSTFGRSSQELHDFILHVCDCAMNILEKVIKAHPENQVNAILLAAACLANALKQIGAHDHIYSAGIIYVLHRMLRLDISDIQEAEIFVANTTNWMGCQEIAHPVRLSSKQEQKFVQKVPLVPLQFKLTPETKPLPATWWQTVSSFFPSFPSFPTLPFFSKPASEWDSDSEDGFIKRTKFGTKRRSGRGKGRGKGRGRSVGRGGRGRK